MDMLRWVLTIMEKTGLTNPPKSHHITSCAVFKPGMLPICLKYFEKWGVLNFEDPGTTLNIGDEKAEFSHSSVMQMSTYQTQTFGNICKKYQLTVY